MFDLAGLSPDEVEILRMSPDGTDLPVDIWEYDLVFQDVELDFPPYLRACLSEASRVVDGLSWLSFEGAFHFDHLFTEDIATQIYGYCVHGCEPVVIWDGEKLSSEDWGTAVRGLKDETERIFRRGDL